MIRAQGTLVRNHGIMSKRAEVHSSNIIGKRQGILRSGQRYKSKGRGIVPGFRNVSFADEALVDDVLNVSQRAQEQHSAYLAEAAAREEKNQRDISCGWHEEKLTN